jgi:nucleotide-binding universal stress UspA family protein
MPMRRVLLLVHDDPGQEARLIAALAVVRATGAELYCVDVTVSPVMLSACYDPRGEALLEEEERAREKANKAVVQARLAEEGISWCWCDASGRIATCLRELAARADLIVISRSLDGFCDQDMRAVATELIAKSERPILAVPEKLRSLDLRGHALIAWNGSVQSSRATRVALPLLGMARETILFDAGPGRPRISVGRVKAFLERQGIHARTLKPQVAGASVQATLLQAISAEPIDYVVMGGFGRRPIIEALFGGVTRAMLTQSPVPLLLAH